MIETEAAVAEDYKYGEPNLIGYTFIGRDP